jgi:hypothetical protein
MGLVLQKRPAGKASDGLAGQGETGRRSPTPSFPRVLYFGEHRALVQITISRPCRRHIRSTSAHIPTFEPRVSCTCSAASSAWLFSLLHKDQVCTPYTFWSTLCRSHAVFYVHGWLTHLHSTIHYGNIESLAEMQQELLEPKKNNMDCAFNLGFSEAACCTGTTPIFSHGAGNAYQECKFADRPTGNSSKTAQSVLTGQPNTHNMWSFFRNATES